VQRKKGLHLLVAAFDRVYANDPDIRLVIAGPEEDSTGQDIRDSRKSLGRDDRVIFAGMLSGLRKWGAYASAELFCLTSHSENFGLVIAEAAACGLPILATNKVNIAGELSHYGAGIIVNDDEESVVQGLLKWQSCPTPVRHAMSDASRRCFLERFDMRLAAEQLMALIARSRSRIRSGSI
jgi:glycosyltransferase involved in cell wall biosynthesis